MCDVSRLRSSKSKLCVDQPEVLVRRSEPWVLAVTLSVAGIQLGWSMALPQLFCPCRFNLTTRQSSSLAIGRLESIFISLMVLNANLFVVCSVLKQAITSTRAENKPVCHI